MTLEVTDERVSFAARYSDDSDSPGTPASSSSRETSATIASSRRCSSMAGTRSGLASTSPRQRRSAVSNRSAPR